MKKKSILKILNNTKKTNYFLKNAELNEIYDGLKASIELDKNELVEKIIIESIKFKKNKNYNNFILSVLKLGLEKSSFVSLFNILNINNFKFLDIELFTEFFCNLPQKPNNSCLDLVLKKFNFSESQINRITLFYLFDTEFDLISYRIESFNIIKSNYYIDSKTIFDFLKKQNLLKELNYSPFGTDSFCFLDFIENFDNDNYIIKNFELFKKHINENFYYINYENHYKKVIFAEKINNF